LKTLSAILIVIMLSGCAVPTVINSKPDGATVYINEIEMGKTPLTYSDKEIVFSQKVIRIEMAGYKPYDGIIKKDKVKVQPLVWGCIVGVPLLWALGYEEEYTIKLERGHSPPARVKSASTKSTSEDLPKTKKTEPQEQAVAQPIENKSERGSSSQGPTTASVTMVVIESKAKLRQKASSKATVIKNLKKGEEVQVIKQKDGWCLVELAGGETGWCHNSVLAQTKR